LVNYFVDILTKLHYDLTSMSGMAREKSNVARKPVGFRIDFELVKMLKILAIEQNKRVNGLIEEAIQDLLRKYKEGENEKIG
jgi:predicted HicB family RNase H-like nuclease